MLNGWTYGGTYAARTGNPFTVYASGDFALTDSRTQRAVLMPGMSATLPSNRHRADKIAELVQHRCFCGAGLRHVQQAGPQHDLRPRLH